jgi:hypothetical protein
MLLVLTFFRSRGARFLGFKKQYVANLKVHYNRKKCQQCEHGVDVLTDCSHLLCLHCWMESDRCAHCEKPVEMAWEVTGAENLVGKEPVSRKRKQSRAQRYI